MLVLTRSINEEIRIGDHVVVRVLDVKGDRVRLGIEAPAEIPVHRQEVYREIERANREALAVKTQGLAAAAELMGSSAKRRTAGTDNGKPRSKNRSQERERGSAGQVENTEVKHGT